MPSEANESVKLWRPSMLHGVELLHATYVTRSFPRHVHDGFAVGVIEKGALGFRYRGCDVVAPAGAINLANPDEVHTGHAASETGWTYRMFYFDAELLRQIAAQMALRTARIPFFPMGVIHDARLAARLHSVHRELEANASDRLNIQTRFVDILACLIRRYADAPPQVARVGLNPGIARAYEWMRAHWNEDLSLNTLANLSDLSAFHFTRVFADTYGLPPHAYLMQLRIHRAKALLAGGQTIAEVALAAGFSDQSHLTRLFKRYAGLTPGQYRARRPAPPILDPIGPL